jgi:hypothetical protein
VRNAAAVPIVARAKHASGLPLVPPRQGRYGGILVAALSLGCGALFTWFQTRNVAVINCVSRIVDHP